jgi:hypothetical protein
MWLKLYCILMVTYYCFGQIPHFEISPGVLKRILLVAAHIQQYQAHIYHEFVAKDSNSMLANTIKWSDGQDRLGCVVVTAKSWWLFASISAIDKCDNASSSE